MGADIGVRVSVEGIRTGYLYLAFVLGVCVLGIRYRTVSEHQATNNKSQKHET